MSQNNNNYISKEKKYEFVYLRLLELKSPDHILSLNADAFNHDIWGCLAINKHIAIQIG